MKSGWDCWNQGERMKMDPHTAGVIRTARHIGSITSTPTLYSVGVEVIDIRNDLFLSTCCSPNEDVRESRGFELVRWTKWCSLTCHLVSAHTLLLQTCCRFLNFSSWCVSTFTTRMKVGTVLKHLQHFLVRISLPAVCSPSWWRDVTTYNVVGYKILDLDWLWSGSFMSCELVTSIIQSVFPNMLCLNEFSVQSFLVSLEQTHWHWYCSSVSTVLLYDAAHVLLMFNNYSFLTIWKAKEELQCSGKLNIFNIKLTNRSGQTSSTVWWNISCDVIK